MSFCRTFFREKIHSLKFFSYVACLSRNTGNFDLKKIKMFSFKNGSDEACFCWKIIVRHLRYKNMIVLVFIPLDWSDFNGSVETELFFFFIYGFNYTRGIPKTYSEDNWDGKALFFKNWFKLGVPGLRK